MQIYVRSSGRYSAIDWLDYYADRINVRKVRVCSNSFIRWAFKQEMSDIFNLNLHQKQSELSINEHV
jgi:hypothetical protein